MFRQSHAPVATTDAEADEMESRCKFTWKTAPKLLLLIVLIGFIVFAFINSDMTTKIATNFLRWLQENPAGGAFAFVGIYITATVFFLPGLILTIGAGFVFSQVVGTAAGVFLATLVVWVGACFGATLAFIVGRYIFRDTVEGWASRSENFGLIEKVVAKSGFKVALLLRLSPIVPFNLFNYIMGLTSVELKDYVFAHVGMLPGTLAYCFVGTTIGAFSELASVGLSSGGGLTLGLIIGGTVLAIVGMVYVAYYGKKEFNRLAAELEEDRADMSDEDTSVIEAGDEADELAGGDRKEQTVEMTHEL